MQRFDQVKIVRVVSQDTDSLGRKNKFCISYFRLSGMSLLMQIPELLMINPGQSFSPESKVLGSNCTKKPFNTFTKVYLILKRFVPKP
jgi:hypothetical protein